MKRFIIFITAFWILGVSNAFAQCSPKEQQIFSAYDSYLGVNSNLSDDVARQRFSKQLGVSPGALKDMYFRCLYSTLTTPSKSEIESSKTALMDCKTLGYRYGYTASTSLHGRKVKSEWDFTMPERCRGLPETSAAITKGSNDGIK